MKAATLLGASVGEGSAHLDIPGAVVDLDAGPGRPVIRADRQQAFVRVPGVADFAVTHGDRVVVDAAPDGDPFEVDACLHATVTALLLGQRGRFALHATVVAIDGIVVALAGGRGAGKTTTALRLSQRGHQLLGDDVSPLEPGERGVIHRPTGRPTHVLPQTAQALGLGLGRTPPLAAAAGKLLIPRAQSPAGKLAVVVSLGLGEQPIVISERACGLRALAQVYANLYRARLVRALWPAESFAWAAAVADVTTVYEVRRPQVDWTVDAVADAVERIVADATPARR